jgi:hypothetical protein
MDEDGRNAPATRIEVAVMNEPVGAHGVDDPQVALGHEVEKLAQRFPDVPRGELSRRVQSAYARLRGQAKVESHLIALTSAQVTAELVGDGRQVQPRAEP